MGQAAAAVAKETEIAELSAQVLTGLYWPTPGCHNGVCPGHGILHARHGQTLIEGCTPNGGTRDNFLGKTDPAYLPCQQCPEGRTMKITCPDGHTEKEFGRSTVRTSSI